MPNKKVTDLTEVTTPADGDLVYIVDVSDTTDSSAGSSRYAQASNLRGWPRTAAEVTAGVTPTNLQYEPGVSSRYITNTTPGTTDVSSGMSDWLDVGLQGVDLVLADEAHLLSTWTEKVVSSDLNIKGGAGSSVKGTSSLDFIRPAGGDIRITGVTFDTWRQVIENDAADSGTTDVLDVRNCKFVTMADSAIDHERPINRYWIVGNEFDACTNHCVRIGRNVYADQDNWQRGHIAKNISRNIDATSTNNASFCLIYGKWVSIEGNQIEDVDSVSGECWAIYTKCRYASIKGNQINDLASSSGSIFAINIKGNDRASTSAPQGFAVVCSGNVLLGSGAGSGIRIQQEDVIVEGNFVENFIVGIDGATSVAYRNQVIQSNEIICADQASGTYGINITGEVDSINCTGNLIYQGYHGIRGASSTGSGSSNWNVSGNTIRDCGNTAMNFDNTTTVTGLMIHDNIIDGATRVLFVDAADEVSIRGNRQKNITAARSLWYDFSGAPPTNMKVEVDIDLQTTDGTNTVVTSFEIPDNTAAILSHEVVAMESDGTDRAMYSKKGLFYRDGAGATQQGSTQSLITDEESDVTWTVALGASSNDILARVTGAASQTINWRCRISMQTVN